MSILPSRVLVTGGTGFIGRHLIAALLARGVEVVALHRRTDTVGLPNPPRLEWARVDDCEAIWRRPPNAIVHLATCYGSADGSEITEANVALPLRLLERANDSHCQTFLSTDTFFGKPGFDYPHMRPYIDSKDRFAKAAADAIARVGTSSFINCRLEHVYGPGDGAQKFTTTVIRKLLANEPVVLTPGAQERDFIYVDDVVEGFVALLADGKAEPGHTETLEIGTGMTSSVRAFVETAKRLSGSTSALHFGALNYRDHEIMHSIADTVRLKLTGWRPRHNIESGLTATLNGFRESLADELYSPGGARG